MTLSIEPRIRKLLEADPVCMGKVADSTLRKLALEFARDPEPDGDVLTERASCLVVMAGFAERLAMICDGDGDGRVALEQRRLVEAMESVRLGLHRLDRPPAAEGSDRTNVRASPSMPPVGLEHETLGKTQGVDNAQG